MNPSLSIIIPVYNVEPYLERCLQSIINQFYTDFEAILIDDGSPDKCGKIIDEYAKKDSRFVPIHQDNHGVSAARNAGLKVSKGKYIGFVDPDDWIEQDMYTILINEIQNKECDIVSCSWMVNSEDGKEIPYKCDLESKVMTGEEYLQHLFDSPLTIAGSVCNKLFKRELIADFFKTENIICEDNFFLALYCLNVRTASYINKPLYHIYFRSNSATREIPEKAALGLPVRREIINIAKQVSNVCGWLAQNKFLDQCIYFCGRKRTKENEYYQFARKEYLNYLGNNPLYILTNNKQMTWKNKLFYYLEYLRLARERKGN